MKSRNEKMRKKLILPAVILLFSTLHAANGTMKIMIQPFSNTQTMKKYAWISSAIEDTITSDFLKIRNISVITEEARKNAIKEIQMGMTGLVDEKSTVKAGKMTGANVIVTGKYTVLGENIRVVAKMIDVTKGQVIKSAKLDGTINDLFNLQDKIVRHLLAEVEKIDRRNIPKIIISKKEKKAIARKIRPKNRAYKWYAKGLAVKNRKPQKGLQYLEKAMAIDPSFARAYRKAAYLAGVRLSNFDKGKKYIIKAERLYRKQYGKNSMEYAEMYLIAGLLNKSRGSYKLSQKNYKKSAGILKKLGKENSREYARVLMNIGNSYIKLGQRSKSLKYYKQCDTIYRKLRMEKTTTYASLMLNTALAYIRRDPDMAISYMMKAQKIYTKHRISSSLSYANLLLNTGVAYSRKKDYDRAISFYKQSLAMRDKLGLGKTAGYASALSSLGSAYYRKKEYRLAILSWNRAENLLRKLNKTETTSFAIIKYNKGFIFMKHGKYKTSAENFEEAYRIYKKIGYKGKNLRIAGKKAAEARRRAAGSQKKNLVKNGSFENGMWHWGNSGHYEQRGGGFRGFWGKANARASTVKGTRHSGSQSLMIKNRSRKAPHVYRTLAQRVSGLKRNTEYRLVFWVKGQNLSTRAFFVTTTQNWDNRIYVRGGTYGWTKFSRVYNTGNNSYLDVRIISEDRGTVFLDDIGLYEEN